MPSRLPASPERNDLVSPRPASRVLLVDDHPITRQGIKALIDGQPEFTVCGEADTAPAAIALSESAQPDVIVVDITLPGTNGIDLVKELKAKAPQTRIVVLSMHDQQ